MKTFLLLLVTIVWGSTFFIIKDTVATVNEYFIVFIRASQAFAALFIYMLFTRRKQVLHRKAFFRGITLGFFLAISYTAQTIGLKYTSTGHSAFITSSAVVIVPFILFFFFKIRILRIDWLAILLVFTGLFLLTYDMDTSINPGDLITLFSAFAGATHLVLAGRYIQKTETIPLISYQFLGTALFSLTAWLIMDSSPVVISTKAWISLTYLGLLGTLFCFFVVVWIQKYISSLKTAIILSLEPVFAALFGFFVIQEVLTAIELTGSAIILSGIILHSILKNRRNPKLKTCTS
ncbi:MAG: DMT family transporter [Bacteroidales bacterium]|jgi:drug/metabolite transporter (DMT)-like permease|nr:DMT family transporter [Bacteroidales bacterium]